MFLNSLAVGVVRANNLLCFLVYFIYEWVYTVVYAAGKRNKKSFKSGNMRTFLGPCSYLPSVTLQEKNKASLTFQIPQKNYS